MQKTPQPIKPNPPIKMRMWAWPPLRMADEELNQPRSRHTLMKTDPFINTRKRIVLKFALLVFCVMGLFPPWKESVSSTGVQFEKDRGYALVFKAPKAQYRFSTVGLDFYRLGLQTAVAALAVAGVLSFWCKQEIQEQPLVPATQS
jgi:hypothetical protein